ncbi:hypothetical protein BKA61DRAFT_697832 [Leptodontidium sp. MPI-SDFR-AT-0119]|nr:hypothetical protein BKA61DRAFT_697832 [Leptodontidium sp. MPI-SDFR-AT-0119]
MPLDRLLLLVGRPIDSWQYTEREEEEELLREATDKGVVNVARYYHHETVRVLGTNDDVRSNVRKGLDIMKAENYRPDRSMISLGRSTAGARKGRSTSTASLKRSSSQTGGFLPPSKRSCSTSPTKAGSNALPNRVHRRVILCDYGKSIYKASSQPSFLIDPDLRIKKSRRGASGAKDKTGTRAFIAIGAFLGEQYSFMHDLESIF